MMRPPVFLNLGLFLTFASTAVAQNPPRLVAMSARPAPGWSGGTFQVLTPPVVNNQRRVAFAAELSGIGLNTTNDDGIWTGSPDNLTLATREGDQAPGFSSGVKLGSFGWVLLSDAGQIGFQSTTSSGSSCYWAGTAGNYGLWLRDGNRAPDTPSGVLFTTMDSYFNRPVLNQSGQVAAWHELKGTGVNWSNSTGIWAGLPGSARLVARDGDQAPGTPTGAKFIQVYPPAINSAGTVAFRAGLTGTGVDTTNDDGIWVGARGTLSLVARAGDSAPGMPEGVKYAAEGSPRLNSAGDVAFSGFVTGPGYDSDNQALWATSGGKIRLLADQKMEVPGLAAGTTFSLFNTPLCFNDAGQVAFAAFLRGPGINSNNDLSIWMASAQSGLPTLILEEGQSAPGLGDGVTFGSISAPMMNGSGGIVFTSTLSGTGITDKNDGTLWGRTSDSSFVLLAREGDTWEVMPGVFRTISGITLAYRAGMLDGGPSCLNNYGDVAFLLSFTDGSSASFVRTIPEPGTALLCAFLCVAFLRSQKRSRLPL